MNTDRYAVSFTICGDIEIADMYQELAKYGQIVEVVVDTIP